MWNLCCDIKLKLWHLRSDHEEKQNSMSHVHEIHVTWCKLKIWHLRFHHNEILKKNPLFNGWKKSHVTCETCVVTLTKTMMFKVLSRKKNKNFMSRVKVMSWHKLKWWHLTFHHNEGPPKKSSLPWVQKTHVTSETCVITQIKTVMFEALSQQRKKKSCHVWNSCHDTS
jgi:hypothetical protein